MKDSFFGMKSEDVNVMITELDSSLVDFLQMTGFIDEVADCNRNSASLATFQKRFFQHFNAFRIIKYLNYSHPDPFLYEKISNVVDKC